MNLTIAQIKSGKWFRFIGEDTFLKGKDTSNKWDMKNTAYFQEYETGKFRTKMRVGMSNGASVELCGMMICRLAGNETAQTAAASCRWIPNGADAMLKDEIVSTMTGASSTDTNQGLYLNSSGQLCINASMIKSGSISADKIKTGTLNSIKINNGNFTVDADGNIVVKSGYLKIKASDDNYIWFYTSSDGSIGMSLWEGNKTTFITPGHIYYTDKKGIYRELTNQGV